MRKTTWNDRRRANKRLRKVCWKRMRARDADKAERKAARRMFFYMLGAAVTGLHLRPSKELGKLSSGFKYGRYCGVGHGYPAGERRKPISPTDAGCRNHDIES